MKDIDLATWVLITAFTLVIPVSGVALDTQKEQPPQQGVEAQSQPSTPAPGMPEYNAPRRGTPGGRVGGGSRGSEHELPMLAVLAPDHTGLTVQEQPSLYWYLSKSTTYPIELTIIDHQTIQPLLEIRLKGLLQPGVQRVRLADHGVHLSPGVPYRWFVALVVDPENRSKDVIAGGAIERTEFPAALRAKLAQAGKAEAPHLYAAEGLWYDALTAISDLMDAAPLDPVPRKQRASLLKQVDLPEIAEYDVH